MMTTDNAVGLYVHIPFCVKKCNYCDFCSFNLSDVKWRKEYIDRICGEIGSYRDRKIVINSIFFGGGTPSLLTPLEFDRICKSIRDCFCVSSDCEFTVEANPKTLDEEKLLSYKANGVNRISMGMQSIHENELKKLGRIHNFSDFLKSFELVRASGISNINIDVMYGIPEQTAESFKETISKVIELRPTHISVYGLILEEGTPFFENKEALPLPTDDAECDMYYLAADLLRENGYNHYEISNYALENKECRHNLKYWRCDDYIGVGLSAYSLYNGQRFGNTANYGTYINNGAALEYTEELEPESRAYEYVMLRLRLCEGFSLKEYRELFGVDFLEGREDVLEELIKLGLINLSRDRLSLTEQGFYVSNSILIKLI